MLKIIYFCSYLCKKCSKTGNLVFFSEIWYLIFLTAVWKENHCDISLLIQNTISFKILILELFHNMLLTYQIAGIQKLWYLKNVWRHEVIFLCVSYKSIGLCLTGMGMPKLLQNYKWAIYSEDKLEGPMESLLSLCISLLRLVSSTFLLKALVCVFLFFWWSYSPVLSRNQQRPSFTKK